jgi:hypothetical protein
VKAGMDPCSSAVFVGERQAFLLIQLVVLCSTHQRLRHDLESGNFKPEKMALSPSFAEMGSKPPLTFLPTDRPPLALADVSEISGCCLLLAESTKF